MRSTIEAGPPAWPMRVLRPWLIATVGGLVIGASLLSINPAAAPNSYSEPVPRAAAYDEAPYGRAPVAAEPPDFAPAPAPAAEGVFAPAAPIAASAELAPMSAAPVSP